MSKYLAIIYCLDPGATNQSFTLSREVDTDDKKKVYDYMKLQAKTTDDAVDTILLVKNGDTDSRIAPQGAPQVYRMWTALNGDFT